MTACFLLFAALLWASVMDVRKRIIPDAVHVMILISGLIFIFAYHQPWTTRLISFFVISILMILTILILDFAGGDVKLIASVSFALGLLPGLVALLTGLFLAAVYALCQKEKNAGVPLAPFIAAGCLFSLLIQNYIYINISFLGVEYFA